MATYLKVLHQGIGIKGGWNKLSIKRDHLNHYRELKSKEMKIPTNHKGCLDDDDNVPFSQRIRDAHVPSHFVLSKIPMYYERGDLAKYLDSFKTHMSLKFPLPL